jgi:hypothetical protein
MNSQKMTRGVVAVIVLVGLLIGLYGVYRYVDAERKLADNEANKIIEAGGKVDVQQGDFGAGYELFKSTIERDNLRRQRADALPFIGVGLAVIGVGWMGYEFVAWRGSRQRRDSEDADTPRPTPASGD